MIDDIMPCPLCGGLNLYNYYYDVDERSNRFDPCVRCIDCNIVLRFHGEKRYTGTIDDIRKVWNRRMGK